jgi:2-polyprenyl-6-hydroxyphenyl methylase/3-demethylubiquinone-9 3-methyltransferase
VDDDEVLAQRLIDVLANELPDTVPCLPAALELASRYAAVYRAVVSEHIKVIPTLAEAAEDLAPLAERPHDDVAAMLEREFIADGSTVAASWNEVHPDAGGVDDFYVGTDSYLLDLEVASRLLTRRIWRQRVLSLVQDAGLEDDPLLDFGCGNGADACYYASHGLRVTGYDLPSAHLRLGRRRASRLGLRVSFIEKGVGALPESAFGAVTCFEVLEHVEDPPGVLAEIAAAVRPGGYVLLTESFGLVGPKYPSHLVANARYDGQLSRLCEAVGLTCAGVLGERIQVFRRASDLR